MTIFLLPLLLLLGFVLLLPVLRALDDGDNVDCRGVGIARVPRRTACSGCLLLLLLGLGIVFVVVVDVCATNCTRSLVVAAVAAI